jgi:hypothetical protein
MIDKRRDEINFEYAVAQLANNGADYILVGGFLYRE